MALTMDLLRLKTRCLILLPSVLRRIEWISDVKEGFKLTDQSES
ncbi:hypothetical protein P4V41_20755 [Fictibacillus nanhaiensis]|nr:hypothetical protein [Fictibacillus nanhaiensis]